MKNVFQLRKSLYLLSLLAISAGLSSCNRGMGCPTNFSLGESPLDYISGFLPTVLPFLP